MLTRNDSVRLIPGVGEVVSGHLERLGITTIGKLLEWYPREYLDASNPTLISQVPYGRLVAVDVVIDKITSRRSQARNVPLTEAKVSDESGEMSVTWFNQTFLKQKLVEGSRWILIGTATRFKGQTVMMSPMIEATPSILSIYPQTKGITSKMLRGYVAWALKNLEVDRLGIPEEIQNNENILSNLELLSAVHTPATMEEVEIGKRGIAFEEVFWFFVRMQQSVTKSEREKGIVTTIDISVLKELVGSLPFELTAGQKRAIWDAVKDMQSGHVMTRLLNGDVGSGKTAVASVLAHALTKIGYQSILLAPTEILAAQHFATAQRLLPNSKAKVSMWTGSRKDDLEGTDIVVGTHAVLQEGFSLPNLGLVVVDEQHRFGVKQRQVLRGKTKLPPHLLSMTATPIPRTLALALYGDLDVSFLPDKPKNRLPVETRIITEKSRTILYDIMSREIKNGRQVFVLCPLIEDKKSNDSDEGEFLTLFSPAEAEAASKKSVLAEVERLRNEFPHLGVVEGVHGKMKAEKKDEIMRDMAAGKINVLVATSVIEVGIDIPNATVMVIEGAEHFGLAQLHQLRGRVGRSSLQSYCFLCPTKKTAKALERLQVLVDTNSGFEVAQADLELRGPGELIGSVQSGLPDFRMASLTDLELLQRVKAIVEQYCKKHPEFLALQADRFYSTNTIGLE